MIYSLTNKIILYTLGSKKYPWKTYTWLAINQGQNPQN